MMLDFYNKLKQAKKIMIPIIVLSVIPIVSICSSTKKHNEFINAYERCLEEYSNEALNSRQHEEEARQLLRDSLKENFKDTNLDYVGILTPAEMRCTPPNRKYYKG